MKKILLFGMLALASLEVNAQTTIFNETFESGSGISMPGDWIRTSMGTGSGNLGWRVYSLSQVANPTGFTGKVAATQALSADNLLYSPTISLPAGSSYSLTFKVASNTQDGAYESDNNYAVYAVAPTSPYNGTQTPVFQELLTVPNVAQSKTVDLSAFAGQDIRLLFRHYNTSARSLIIDDVKVTQMSTLATSEVSAKNQVSVYPNPATDYLMIKSEGKINSIETFDMMGRRMDTMLDGNKVNVKNLTPGAYIITVDTKGNKFSQKFIKK
ncbi:MULTISPECIES: T9SS-dependent choice-of-anchor J family protein [Chryseobacterium]|uniref:Secreted protein (Por secretion system target) n=1 Tax=Chryseobacterium geocarposphaerae TaxID=1416776 RepID=A0ABU1LCA5_9FLAO|nr:MULTISPECIES: choice-of-anchor J domain-containing protein [Chryseobacterium]MDR6404362.1 hypothetical protein [Chryseobacterium geocarposphaerae]MDR6699777.1 hypothetical protein [Chryseobacterium ginsenosidimutans]